MLNYSHIPGINQTGHDILYVFIYCQIELSKTLKDACLSVHEEYRSVVSL